MDAWTPGAEELALILGIAKEAEKTTGIIELVAPNARTGERKRKVAHIIACCEASLDALAAEAHKQETSGEKPAPDPDPAKDPGAYNRKKISAAVEEAASSGAANV